MYLGSLGFQHGIHVGNEISHSILTNKSPISLKELYHSFEDAAATRPLRFEVRRPHTVIFGEDQNTLHQFHIIEQDRELGLSITLLLLSILRISSNFVAELSGLKVDNQFYK